MVRGQSAPRTIGSFAGTFAFLSQRAKWNSQPRNDLRHPRRKTPIQNSINAERHTHFARQVHNGRAYLVNVYRNLSVRPSRAEKARACKY